MSILGCIADDFTGASDLAGILAKSGFAVSLRIGIPKQSAKDIRTDPFEIIALKCRSLPVQEALNQCKEALHWLKDAGCERFFWKYCSTFDSTPQGNIGQVAQMLMQELNTKQTIYCPAFPQNDRRVFMGHLFVKDELLNESAMKDHPLNPMSDSHLVRWLQLQVEEEVGLINQIEVAQGADNIKDKLRQLVNTKHIIVDAISDEDLTHIAKAVVDMPLVTGGSAISLTLPKLYQDSGLLSLQTEKFTPPIVDQGRLVLSGSCSAMTRKQVANYIDSGAKHYQLDPLIIAKEGIDAVKVWLKEQAINDDKIIYATAKPQQVKTVQNRLGIKAGAIVEQALADIAKEALRIGIRQFIIAGGESSGAVTNALGIDHLTIGQEIAAGVPLTYAKTYQNNNDGDHIALALKSGNFGDEQFFTKALRLLNE